MRLRKLAVWLMGAATAITAMTITPSAAQAGTVDGHTGAVINGQAGTQVLYYQAVDADNDPYSGIYLRWATNMEAVKRVPENYVPYGTTVRLECGTWGEAVGPYQNRRWHLVVPQSGPAAGQYGWIADRYLNTPNKANQPTPGEPECSF